MALLQVSHRCPHCRELKDFVISQASENRERPINDDLPPLWTEFTRRTGGLSRGGLRPSESATEFVALSRCPNCGHAVLFVMLTDSLEFVYRLQNFNLERHREDRIPAKAFHVLVSYPRPVQFDAHPSWPEKIQAPFIELQEDVVRGRTAGRIIAGCRSILDVATKDLLRKYRPDDPDPERPNGKRPKEDIFTRVNALAELGLLTGALGEWAHKLRKLGADATHDLDGDPDEAKQFVEFLKLFLHVAYELPQAIKDQWPDAPDPDPLEALARLTGAASR
ncbi:DUF4145 domain-containing protein [Bosea sp. 2KB_26]|uniref:DUF4145 domain-containing protein n=1 Tax=Bosea sp. 2KB_26 TaxID=3237475 RepID=UPI003F8DD4C2